MTSLREELERLKVISKSRCKCIDYTGECSRCVELSQVAPVLLDVCLELGEASRVINEGDTVFQMAVSRVENCRCAHETCDLCVLSRALINQVEIAVRYHESAAEKLKELK